MRKRWMLAILGLSACLLSGAADIRWTGGRWWGISLSYSLKWYTYSSGGRRHSCNFWGDDGKMQGIRFGIPVEPVIWRGIGISTGFFGEVYSCKNDGTTKRVEQFNLYLPLQAMYRYRLNDNVSFSASTGPGVSVGILQKVIDPKNSSKRGYSIPFGDGSPRRVDWLWEVQLGATVKMFRFSVVYSVSMTPSTRFMSVQGAGIDYVSVTPMGISVNAGLVF